MSRSKLMLGTLQRAHGEWVSRAELFDDAGSFYLSNNAASELNAKGWTVEHRIVKGLHSYRLVGGLTEPGEPGTGQPPGSVGSQLFTLNPGAYGDAA